MKERIIDALVEYQNTYRNNPKLFCEEHNKKNKYICFDCLKYYCSKCLFLNKHNSNHLLTEQYALGDKDDYYDALLKIYKPVVTFKEYINNKYLSDIESKIIELQNQKNEQITFYQKYIKVLANRFDTLINNLNKIKNEYKTFSTNYNKQCEIGFSVIKEITNKKDNLSIDNTDKKLLQIIDIVDQQEDKILPQQYIMSSSPFELEENMLSFTIHNYPLIIKHKWPSKEDIYSPIFTVDYLSWKLRIYPWGDRWGKDTHISIYLFLKEGGDGNRYNYDYKFELVNFKEKKNYDRGWTHYDFVTNGTGRGYPQYYKIEDIEKDGFIDDEGNLTVNCYLKPSSIKEISKAINNYTFR